MINVVPTPPGVLAAFQRLYGDFVGPGDLVFDIGANIGENTSLFASLGARVVAVEPLEQCAAAISACATRANWDVQVERCALGRQSGSLAVSVCSRALDISSASAEWMDAMQQAGLARGPWDMQVVVPVSTLDALIMRYGFPSFIKVDVEGYEAEVLRGLSQRVNAISLETHRATLATSLACLERLGELGFARFAISAAHSAELSPWMDERDVAAAVAALEWGDLYAC
jgi:FkbM family methyltransferase